MFLVSHRPYAVIRRHNTLDVTLDELAGARADLDEMIDPLLRDFLRAAMRAGLNIMVAGLAGAGKTTVIRALMNEIPADEPYVLLEESRELLPARRMLKHRAVMSFESREGHGERGPDGRPAGEVTIADLIPLSLRMGVLRIIVGEVRSREIVPMLQAMTTSRGSMCTIHARTAAGVNERIIELALSHGREMTVDQARRMAGNALDLIVYVTVEDETAIGGRKHRFVSHVEEVIGVTEHNRISTTTVFGPGPDGRAVPRHLPERVRDQLLRIGYDARMLSRYIEAGTGAWRRPRHSRAAAEGDVNLPANIELIAVVSGAASVAGLVLAVAALVGTSRPPGPGRVAGGRLVRLLRGSSDRPADRRRHQALLIGRRRRRARSRSCSPVCRWWACWWRSRSPGCRGCSPSAAPSSARSPASRRSASGPAGSRTSPSTGQGLQQAIIGTIAHRAGGDRRGGTAARRTAAGRLARRGRPCSPSPTRSPTRSATRSSRR